MKKKYWLHTMVILYCHFFNKLKKIVELTLLKFFKKSFHILGSSEVLKGPLKTYNLTFLYSSNTFPKIDLTFGNLLYVIKNKLKPLLKEFSSLPDLTHYSSDKFSGEVIFCPFPTFYNSK